MGRKKQIFTRKSIDPEKKNLRRDPICAQGEVRGRDKKNKENEEKEFKLKEKKQRDQGPLVLVGIQ